MVGCVGADEPGGWLIAYLRDGGVEVDGVQRAPEAITGQALISLSDDGENCIVVASGANLKLAPSASAAAGARVVLAQLETGFNPVATMFNAVETGCIRVLNAAPSLPAGAALFDACEVLVVNETELAAYAAASACPETHDEIAGLARRLMRRSEQAVVVTLGAMGALLTTAQDAVHLAGHRTVEVIDTVGAGDCFCGVMAGALAENRSLAAAVARANVAAALAVSRRGAAEAMPRRDEILDAENLWAPTPNSPRPDVSQSISGA